MALLQDKTSNTSKTSLIGKSVERVDSIDKVLGKPIYSFDILPENCLYLKIVRSTHAHALLRKVDVSQARQYPGVVLVITAADIPGINEATALLPDKPLLADTKVRFVGEPIAAIASHDQSIAEEAIDLVKIEYEDIPAVFSPIDALKPDAPKIHKAGNIAKHLKLRKGDVEEGFKQADHIVEGIYKTQFQEPVPLEPETGFVIPEPDGSVTCVGSMQSPFHVQTGIAKILSLRADQVRVIQAATGGAFGPKSDEMPVDILGMAAIVALKTRRPTALAYTREESMIGHTKRHPFVIKLRAGVKENGKLTAWSAELIADTGAYASLGPLVITRALFHATGPYDIPHVKSDSYCVYTNNTMAGSFRGFGGPQSHFAAESHVEEIAKKIGMDPLEFRRINMLKPGSLTATSQVVDEGCGLEECVEKVVEASNWHRKRSEYSKQSGTIRKGIGIAIMYHGNSLGPEGSDYVAAHMNIDRDGTIRFRTALTEYGTGATSGLLQIAAETMNLPITLFKLEPPDTDYCNDAGPTVASRTTAVGGRAAQMVAGKLHQRLKEIAAELLDSNIAAIESSNGSYYVRDRPQSTVSYLEVVQSAYKEGIELKVQDTFTAPKCEYDPEISQGTTYLQYTYGAVIAEVEVDTETGKVQVDRMVAAYDVGKAINPLSVEGQIEGGTIQGLGYGVMEELIHEDGIVRNPNLADYYIPTSKDIPEIKSIIVEHPGQLGPYGAKVIGEPPIVLPAAAIVNAIDHAIGIRLAEIPATPDRVLLSYKSKRN
ncbi:MAG TPA: xanthine dehydrogenase family protein molybdopterin-binding subunit [Methylomirabilota bacterium]|nr:xanthine dehydrogenase family protein molybdopterin-binding subunit [Methylomirabilota bacterium]